MSRLNKKQRREKKWNNKYIKKYDMKDSISEYEKAIEDMRKNKLITESEKSSRELLQKFGREITQRMMGDKVKINYINIPEETKEEE